MNGCPVCLGECGGASISDPWMGSKYDCPVCLRFYLTEKADSHVRQFLKDKKEARAAISAHIRAHQIEDKFLPLTWNEICKILREANVK